MGHNMGAHHDRTTAGTSQGAYPYSYGYWILNPATSQYDYRTIMAYNTLNQPNGSGGYYTYQSWRVNYWSNPNINYPTTGTPTGKAEANPQSAYNAKTLNNTAPYVAQFRDGPAPAAVTGPTATSLSATQVRLDWTAVSDAYSGAKYRIERALYSGGAWGAYAEIGQVASLATATYTDNSADSTKDSKYRVVTDNGNGRTISSLEAVVSAVAAPSNLVSSFPTGTTVKLDWASTSPVVQNFRVERVTGSLETWAEIATPAAAARTYTDTPPSYPPAEYRYRVRAYSTGGVYSAYSNLAYTRPNAPSGLAAAAASQSRINLSWTDNSQIESGFNIERSPNGTTDWAQIGTAAAGATSFSNADLACSGSTYYYRVYATNAAGASASPSNTASAATSACTAPDAPAALTASARTPYSITLQWSNVDGETGYRILKKVGGSFVEIGTTAMNVVTYTASGLQPRTSYQFQVIAVNSSAASPNSFPASLTASTMYASFLPMTLK